ncbi:MAG: hypothetical protein ACRYF9_25865 [Janthinobacterium lividum]
MSYPEFLSWRAYMHQTGTLNLGLRIEQGVALLATIFNRGFGGKAEFSDFLPDREPAPEPDKDAQAVGMDIMRLLQSVKR